MSNQPFSIGIIGAGFSGALMAVHLLRRCRPSDRVYLIERRAGFGRGLAYSTANLHHLLNVRAGNMSAFQDDPDHFVEWLRSRSEDGVASTVDADSFVSRRLYGTYIRSLLGNELWQSGKGRNLFLVPDQAVALNEDPGSVTLTVAGGRCYRLDMVVLAAGNLQAEESANAYFSNPWDPKAITGIPKYAPALLIGSGLTMVDTVQSLLDAGHKGKIIAISRRGLLPQVHAATKPLELAAWDLPKTTSIVRLTRWLRGRVRAAAEAGYEWRAVVDGLRPHLQDLWRRLPLEDRRRFLRHLRPWWDTHRHRMAPAVSAQLEESMNSGQLTVIAARILGIAAEDHSAVVQFRRRNSEVVESLTVSRVIGCSGLDFNVENCRDPLIRDLLVRRFARSDPLGLGLEVSEQGALLNAAGVPSRRLYGIGPITRGSFWEIVAVPDIRLHCARLANYLSARVHELGRANESVRESKTPPPAPPQHFPQRHPDTLRPHTRKA